jgi:hypothetical protein
MSSTSVISFEKKNIKDMMYLVEFYSKRTCLATQTLGNLGILLWIVKLDFPTLLTYDRLHGGAYLLIPSPAPRITRTNGNTAFPSSQS